MAIIADAEALHLRSTTHQHAKLLDDALQDDAASVVTRVPTNALRVTLALLDEHEAMNRSLVEYFRAFLERLEERAMEDVMDSADAGDTEDKAYLRGRVRGLRLAASILKDAMP